MPHRLTRALALAVLTPLLLPVAASAATATAHVHGGGEAGPQGPVAFHAARGEVNRVTISDGPRGTTFRDTANPVHAKGDCDQVGRHAAVCPFSEDGAVARLGDRGDRVRMQGDASVIVRGGSGDDVLTGGIGSDQLRGDTGDDVIRGGRHDDELTGGPGRDRVFGDSGDDKLIDGETDGQAAHDLYRGGNSRDTRNADYGDVIDYSRRRHGLRIDLGRRRSNSGDRILGLESILGGHGDDRLTGDGDDNELVGGGGDDVLRGRAGKDTILAGAGDDTAYGDDGDDVLWGHSGHDRLRAGGGDDLLESRDDQAEHISCGAGDDDVVGNRSDRLGGSCEVAVEQTYSGVVSVRVRPAIADGTATFGVACSLDDATTCGGTIALSGPDGTDYGSRTFNGLSNDPETFTDVSVPLTPAGVTALRAGTVLQVAYGRRGGYRTYVQGGSSSPAARDDRARAAGMTVSGPRAGRRS